MQNNLYTADANVNWIRNNLWSQRTASNNEKAMQRKTIKLQHLLTHNSSITVLHLVPAFQFPSVFWIWRHHHYVHNTFTHTNISDDELKQHINYKWTVGITLFIQRAVGKVASSSTCLISCWRQTFRAYHVKMMQRTFDDFWENNCQSCL